MRELMKEKDIVRWLVESDNVLLRHHDRLILVDRKTLARAAAASVRELADCGPERDRWMDIQCGLDDLLPVIFDKYEDACRFYGKAEGGYLSHIPDQAVMDLVDECGGEISSWEAVWR